MVLLDIDGVIHDRQAVTEIRFSDDADATAAYWDPKSEKWSPRLS